MKRIFLTGLLVASCGTANAEAMYFGGSAGAVLPRENDVDLGRPPEWRASSGAGFTLAGFLGKKFGETVGLEAELIFQTSGVDEFNIGGNEYKVDGDITNLSAFLNGAVYRQSQISLVSLYLKGGLGITQFSYDIEGNDGDDTVGALQLQMGLETPISSSAKLFGGYRFNNPFNPEITLTDDNGEVWEGAKINYATHSIEAGFRF
jgi:opacity protein-like surface antigen